ncbi:MAG: hypothetical protein P0Y53_24950 [Candidatus Pseudobacter hemicellulosilyticus]|uniref:Uncharacterized protein n=1 Tax=Candidatus Pseudobacter hemicellulosilyticus TaxID=3121375 RepID=A0AAJ6BG28_9BACT|nr:MAG: hypothetical protein P0Y53_24950 [Pseudobacter sp.]
MPDRILEGIRKAVKKLVEKSAANGESLVIGDNEGNFKEVDAEELLKKMQQQ